jgi:FixJ family two-component response regulator
MTATPVILIVDDDRHALKKMLWWVRTAGYPTVAASSFDVAWRLLLSTPTELLITKARLGPFNGVRLLQYAHQERPQMSVLLLGPEPDALLDIEARRWGALFMVMPESREALVAAVRRLLPDFRPEQRWPRKRLRHPMPIKVLDRDATIVDVSYGGLCFEMTGYGLPQNFDVDVDWFDLTVRAESVWASPVANGFRYGAMVVSAPEAAEARWRMLVDLTPSALDDIRTQP